MRSASRYVCKYLGTIPLLPYALTDTAAAQAVKPWWEGELGDVSSIALKGLIFLFVFAILIESALAVIFNWRLFLEVFNGRGMKTLVMIAVSALAVHYFNIDVVRAMAAKYNGETIETIKNTPLEVASLPFWITTLILAGGSSGVYNILVALGYRQRAEPEAARLPVTGKAWISVRVIRNRAVGPINIRISHKGAATAGSPAALAGIIAPRSFRRIWYVFFLDWTRIPRTTTGKQVDVGQEYEVKVEGYDAQGNLIPSPIDGVYTFAERAIIDFEVTL